ncbi:MAG: hypothetical protein F6K19_07530 [Cyanothece sp. SIO1E1]|nr:hypothetical protein [Cyanothece sp. SIO1E1]
MSVREQLIKEIAQAPDFLVEEVLNFFLFIKARLKNGTADKPVPESSPNQASQSFLGFVDEISAQIAPEEWAKLPSDLSKNLDHYLYGAPRNEK